MEEYGNVTRNKIRSGNGYQVKAVMVCYSEKEEAEIAIKEINKYTGWRAEEYRIQTDKQRIQRETLIKNKPQITMKEKKKEKKINKVKEQLTEIQNALRSITGKQQ